MTSRATGGPGRRPKSCAHKDLRKYKKILDKAAACCYNMRMENNLDTSADLPECELCEDDGMVHGPNDTQDFCSCEVGQSTEQAWLDYCDADDDYADADALASAGMGTDEDYGCYDSGDYF